MKDTTAIKEAASTTAPPDSAATRASRKEGIVKDAIGMTDVKTLRARARQGIEDGAMTAGYKAKVEAVITLLNEALATEIVCVLRYKRHYFMAKGISSLSVKGEFLQHATEEQVHADQLAERPAVKRGRMVNRGMGESSTQLLERHDARDFEVNTQDKVLERGGERI